ncbi:MAG: MaoC family dehydratase N-terminal domain-containing protein [Planctomycetales bacterium]|nr:MaoC family dehydratase N-terminal domain-containing protein [Planctomycetales bacterium]
MSPLYFEDLRVGDTWQSQTRTVSEQDIVQFADMTGDFNPLHVDHEFAKTTPFRQVIAHGLLGLSWVAGLGSNHPLMRTEAFLGIEQWEFARPTFIGDTVHVKTEVLALESSGRRRGKVVWRRQLINQNDDVVQQGRFVTLVSLRSPLNRRTDAAETSVRGPHIPVPSRG